VTGAPARATARGSGRRGDAAPRAGRPRDAGVDAAILRAAWRLLRDEGYARLSIAAVAQAARVGRPAIYRRYRGKPELVAAVVADRAGGVTPIDTGHARDDLIAHLEAVRKRFPVTLAGTLMAKERASLLAQLRREMVAPPRDAIAEALRRGQERGEVRAGLDTRVAAEALMGSFVFASLAQGRPGPGWSEMVVDVLWSGFANHD
jgi:AcrR family transcriptional regulator